ncbi:hypothetical protein Vafri_6384, partial [Volvox africanus]
MVVLEKPVGLTLAPDPKTGQVVIQDVKPNSPAHKCGLIQVGDVVKCCSAVFGDDMWVAADIRRVRWAINSRMGDVKLLLERGRRLKGGLTAWYCGGKVGSKGWMMPRGRLSGFGCRAAIDTFIVGDLCGDT